MTMNVQQTTGRKTIEELRRELEELKARPIAEPTKEEEERARLRADIAKAKAKAKDAERRQQELHDDELFERLEAKYGVELHRIDTVGRMVVMRAPSVAKARHLQQLVLKGKLSVDAITDFVGPCVVCPCDEETLEPDGDAFEAMLEEHTLLSATLCSMAQEIGSADAKRREKKS
jgi:hypothetical protein